ncbi:MAG: GAF domain-containing protein [Anaerolineaceae bacterium]|nr:GAF domain-containing protein [Anaerolineaceae bacterium]MCB9101212.1 GAF domain-containing protein [Anaerolineales bacterium]
MGRERKDLVALYNIAVAVGSSLSLKEVIWRLYKEATRSIDPANFAIVIYDEHKDKLIFYLVYDQFKPIKPFTLKHSSNAGLISQVLNTKRPLLINDLSRTTEQFEINRMHPNKPARSWLGVPFFNANLSGENAQGVIAIWNYKTNAYSERDLWFLSEIATQAAIAIRNANLFEASQRRILEMSVVNDVARTLSSTLELEEVLHRIMDQVEEMLNVSAGFLLLKDPTTEDLTFQIGLGQTKNIDYFRIPKGKGVAGHVAVTGKPMHVEKKQHPIDFHAENLLCVPLVLHNQVIGVLEVLNKKEGHFSQNDLELLSSIASFAAIAIENARLHESVLDERDRVIEAEEQARKALARDLHDGPVQLVSSLSMRLNFCQRLIKESPNMLVKELPTAMQLADRAVHQMRTMLFELRPLALEVDGLESALKTFVERQQHDISEKHLRLTLSIETDNPQGHLTRQDSKVETALFAIVQEAVTNAIKHAQSSYIQIQLRETPTALYATVADDGVGFNVDEMMENYSQRSSLGLINIKERTELIGGDLAIRSVSGKGTKIRVFVPKAQQERLKKRGQSGVLSNSRRVQTALLSKSFNGNNH